MLYLDKLKNIKKSTQMSVKKMFFMYYVLMILLSLVIITYVSVFLYKNFYQTITQSEEIILLKKEVSAEDIDMNKFDKMILSIEEKQKTREVDHILSF
jgi:uncharacterized membrane protein